MLKASYSKTNFIIRNYTLCFTCWNTPSYECWGWHYPNLKQCNALQSDIPQAKTWKNLVSEYHTRSYLLIMPRNKHKRFTFEYSIVFVEIGKFTTHDQSSRLKEKLLSITIDESTRGSLKNSSLGISEWRNHFRCFNPEQNGGYHHYLGRRASHQMLHLVRCVDATADKLTYVLIKAD